MSSEEHHHTTFPRQDSVRIGAYEYHFHEKASPRMIEKTRELVSSRLQASLVVSDPKMEKNNEPSKDSTYSYAFFLGSMIVLSLWC